VRQKWFKRVFRTLGNIITHVSFNKVKIFVTTSSKHKRLKSLFIRTPTSSFISSTLFVYKLIFLLSWNNLDFVGLISCECSSCTDIIYHFPSFMSTVIRVGHSTVWVGWVFISGGIVDTYFPSLSHTKIKYLNSLSGPFFELCVLVAKPFLMAYCR